MSTRVTDSGGSARTNSQINFHRSRLAVLQERLASGKRINRPSDDPAGAEMVLNLRTSLKQIEQFQRNAQAVSTKLIAGDDSLSSYETTLDRVKTLLARGLSETSTPQTREAVAVELESLSKSILSLANSKSGDEYVFGGTRQTVPPFDPVTGQPAAGTAVAQHVQIEPGSNAIAAGVTGDTVFGDANATIFADIANAVAALRGTGNAAADRATLQNTMSRMSVYGDLAGLAHARIGANMNAVETAMANLSTAALAHEDRITDIEGDDFAATALGISETERALEATLQVAARGRRSLFDFIG